MATPNADPQDKQDNQEVQQDKKLTSRLGSVLSTAWRIYKQNPLSFIGLYCLPFLFMAISGMLTFLFLSSINTSVNKENAGSFVTMFAVGLIVWFLVFWVIITIAKNAGLRGAYSMDTKGKIPFMQCYKDSASKFFKAIGLSIRIFLYTRVWALILLVCLFPLFAYLTKMASQYSNDQLMGVMGQINSAPWILPVVILAVFILLIGRFCKAAFSFPVLMSKDVNSKEALQESIALAKDRVGRIFGNYLLYGLVVGILSAIFQQVVIQLVGLFVPTGQSVVAKLQTVQSVALFINQIVGAIIGSFSIVFNYAFMKNLRIEKEGK